MIQFLSDNIDQLDLALDQLAVSERNFDRFALMLIDNVVELTLHRFAQDMASDNDAWKLLGKAKHDPKTVELALGQNFDSKAKGSRKLGLLDEALCESILNLHGFRNTAYHRGLRHDGILHSITIFYFRNACTLLKSYKPRYWSWSSADAVSHRAMKYLGEPRLGRHEETFIGAYDRLDCVAASMKEDLIGDLARNMSEIIDSVDQELDFLAKDAPQRRTRNQVVIESQAWPFAFTDEAKTYAKANGYDKKDMAGLVQWITENYDWPVKNDPIDSWRVRLDALRSEKDYHRVLKRYCDFIRQTDDLRSHIGEAAVQLDSYIQQQIDIARGK